MVSLNILGINERLPKINIPLRLDGQDVILDLQPLIEEGYRRGRYERSIDYNKDPIPPLGEKEAAWADELLRKAGKRIAPPASKRKRPRE